MISNSIRREFWFSAAHRIEGHPKCGRLHGHNYKVVIQLSGKLNTSGMVLDFGEVDKVVKPLIDEMDHRYIVSDANIKSGDRIAEICREEGWEYQLLSPHSTAEMIARHIHEKVSSALQWFPSDLEVTVQETPRNEATYRG